MDLEDLQSKESLTEVPEHGAEVSLDENIKAFIEKRRETNNISNQEEFIETVTESTSAARLATMQLDKEIHIKSSVADNLDGPLSRSIIMSTSGTLVSPHGFGGGISSGIADVKDRPIFNGLEERIRNVETHLGIVVPPLDKSLVERVKTLEDKILKIEQYYPQIAAHVFNYGKAEVEASSRPGGRVSKLTSGPGNSKKRQKEDPIQTKGVEDESSLTELKQRMDDLKNRLLKQAKR